ncbi:MAG: ABC transporter permease [Bacteroidota bacterium]
MSNHSLKLAIRNLLKQKSFSLISLAGLATSMAASIVVLTYFFHEISYDKHIPGSERTFRIISRLGEGKFWARTFASYGDALENATQVESYTSFINARNSIVTVGESEYTIEEVLVADTSFIDFFGLELVSGRKEDLGLPNQIYVTEEMAETFFPGEDPLGRDIFLRQFERIQDSVGYFTVAGILKPLPDNTHFGFQLVFSQQGHFSQRMKHIKENKYSATNVYVRLFNETPPADLETELIDMLVPYLGSAQGPPMEAFKAELQPVRDIHFTPDINREPRPVTRKSMLYLLLSVGLLILLLMTLNFISMVIVQSNEQSRASRIMRLMGANNRDLFSLSLLKIAIIVVSSLLLTWMIITLADSGLKTMFGGSWSLQALSQKAFLVSLAAGLFVILLTALGSYFSFSGGKSFGFFGWLSVIQFAIVILLVGFSMMIHRQITYLDSKDLGYSKDNLIVTLIPGRNIRGGLLVEEMQKHAGVVSAYTAQYHPGDVFQSMDLVAGGHKYQFGFQVTDPGIFETLEIELIHRFASPTGKMRGWVINESFYKNLLLDFSPEDVATSNFILDHVDEENGRNRFEVAGVMKDFHFSSLHSQIGNFAFIMRDQEIHPNRYLMTRFSKGQSKAVLQALHQMMDTHFPGKTITPFLLEDKLKEQYENSHKLSRVIRLLTLLSILIAISGLYGLSLYLTRRRTREIGLRKIHGANTPQIIGMLNRGFLKWLGLAFVIAAPLTLWALGQWLNNFAYRTTQPWWIIALSGLLVAVIAMIAVTWQTSNAARMNPVETTRYE